MPATITTRGLGWRPHKLVAIVLLAITMIWLGVASRPVPAHAWITIPICDSYSGWQDRYGDWADIPSIGSETTNFSCLLFDGVTSNGVYILQRTLNDCYGFNLAVDGIFGYHTKAALMQVQSWLRITADGVYGSQTRGAMDFEYFHFPPNSILSSYSHCHRLYTY